MPKLHQPQCLMQGGRKAGGEKKGGRREKRVQLERLQLQHDDSMV